MSSRKKEKKNGGDDDSASIYKRKNARSKKTIGRYSFNMASEMLPAANSKKRRIMIITGDESIIEQIQHTDHSSLVKSYIIDPKNGDKELCYLPDKTEVHAPHAKKAKTGSLTCVVCGSPALGYNFDAITCESCKAFFRRNALKDFPSFYCRRNGGCEITAESRRRCSACRLTKCLSMGMRRERLLTAEEKAAKRREIEQNRTLTIQNHYDELGTEESQIIPSELLEQLSSFEESNLFGLTDLIDIQSPADPQPSRSLLSSEELHRIETIELSFKQRIELAARDGLPWNPSVHATNLLQHVNSRSVPAMRLVTFFKQIPEFNQLNVDDKVTLIKYNLMPLVLLNNTLGYNAVTHQVKETDSDVPLNYKLLEKVHGTEIYNRVLKIFDSFVRIAQHDQRIIQLALIILILTRSFPIDFDIDEPILNDGGAVYQAQQYYIELLWKYMETVHGSHKSVCIFSDLVAHFMSWQIVQKDLRSNLRRQLTTIDTNELLPIMKSLLHIP